MGGYLDQFVEFTNRVVIEKAEVAKQHRGHDVIAVQKKLVHLERRCACGVKPNLLTSRGLAELGPITAQQQWRGQSVSRTPRRFSHQFGPDGDVAPLIGAAQLQSATLVKVEPKKVIRLEQHVGELGK